MSNTTMDATISDARVARCGIHISHGKMLKLTPFVEFAQAFDGVITVEVTNRSSAGSNTTHQENAFKAGHAPQSHIWIDRGSSLLMAMDVKDDRGKTVCDMRETVVL
ncbi:curli-like amyloid fiber formation chaperone CsgH [Rhizobium sp. Root482]|uniref:curli-like amyloid fiber formation chaperone CsgH n=1 Tax=Rhizobium sp. Root482 TaxID=1736543 RepID=UPI0012E34D35|nr:curli-like amyloid fiber formation chaperone CsgH [Rhizobium sp. Root482]